MSGSALHEAATYGKVAIMKQLVQSGAAFNIVLFKLVRSLLVLIRNCKDQLTEIIHCGLY